MKFEFIPDDGSAPVIHDMTEVTFSQINTTGKKYQPIAILPQELHCKHIANVANMMAGKIDGAREDVIRRFLWAEREAQGWRELLNLFRK